MRLSRPSQLFLISVMTPLALVACGGGGSDKDDPVALYSVGGELAGLASNQTLVLQNNGANDLTISSNGKFEFGSPLTSGQSYAVAVSKQPEGQTCTVANATGTASATVNNIQVQCVDDPVAPVDTTTSAACFNFDKPYTKDSSWTYTYTNGKSTYLARGESTYKGKAAYHLSISGESDGSKYSQGRYINTGDGVDYIYGYENSSGVVFTLVEYLPSIATPRSITLNQPVTIQYTRDRNVNLGGLHDTTPFTQTRAYLGRETIQTSFGNFETCKMEYRLQESGGPETVTTDWVIASGKLRGLVAQSQSQGQITQPVNIEVNW